MCAVFNVTCQRNEKVTARIRARANYKRSFECHPTQEARDRREKGKEQGRCFFENFEPERENDPSAIPFCLLTEIFFLELVDICK